MTFIFKTNVFKYQKNSYYTYNLKKTINTPEDTASIIRLAFLSPSIMEKISKGNIPHDMTLTRLKKNIPLVWSEQEHLFQ